MKRISLFLCLILTAIPALRAADAATVAPAPAREAFVMHFDGDWLVAGGLPAPASLPESSGCARARASCSASSCSITLGSMLWPLRMIRSLARPAIWMRPCSAV